MPQQNASKRSTMRRIVRERARERRELGRVVDQEDGLDDARLDEVRERAIDELGPGRVALRGSGTALDERRSQPRDAVRLSR